MPPNSPSSRRLRAVSGGAMLATPVLLLLATIASPGVVPPGTAERPAQQLEIVAADRGRFYAATVLALLAAYVLIVAVLGLVEAARSRRPRSAYLGGALAIVGAVAQTDQLMMSVIQWGMTKPGLERAPMVALFDEAYGGGISAAYAPVVALPLGFVVLAISLRRAGVVRRWQATLLGISFIALWFSDNGSSSTPGIVAVLILLAGLGSVGWAVILARGTPLSSLQRADLLSGE